MKYRKKSDPVEVIQWDGSNYDEVKEFVIDEDRIQLQDNGRLWLWTLEGGRTAYPGYYIIREKNRGINRCDPATFHERYEPVVEEHTQDNEVTNENQ